MDKMYLMYTKINSVTGEETTDFNEYTTDDYGTNKRDRDYEMYMAFEGDMYKTGSIRYVTPYVWDGKGSRETLAIEPLVYNPDGKLLKDRYGLTMTNKPDGNVPKSNADGPYSKTLAQCAYETYAEHQDWKAFNGDPLPNWADVREPIKKAWEAAVDAVIENQQKY